MEIYRLLQKAAFDDRAVSAMTTAYDGVLRNLGLVDRSDPVTEIVANKIIELARTGERDPDRMREIALHDLRGQPRSSND
jgi:hypothetical protein